MLWVCQIISRSQSANVKWRLQYRYFSCQIFYFIRAVIKIIFPRTGRFIKCWPSRSFDQRWNSENLRLRINPPLNFQSVASNDIRECSLDISRDIFPPSYLARNESLIKGNLYEWRSSETSFKQHRLLKKNTRHF